MKLRTLTIILFLTIAVLISTSYVVASYSTVNEDHSNECGEEHDMMDDMDEHHESMHMNLHNATVHEDHHRETKHGCH